MFLHIKNKDILIFQVREKNYSTYFFIFTLDLFHYRSSITTNEILLKIILDKLSDYAICSTCSE